MPWVFLRALYFIFIEFTLEDYILMMYSFFIIPQNQVEGACQGASSMISSKFETVATQGKVPTCLANENVLKVNTLPMNECQVIFFSSFETGR